MLEVFRKLVGVVGGSPGSFGRWTVASSLDAGTSRS
jgi:hypothetical protein